MLRILFFARIREELDCATLDWPWPGQAIDLDTLQEDLCLAYGAKWREVLSQDNVIRAVNQTVTNDNCALHDGDEVAFFPPVTGG
ncbi:MAG: MoaD/ThiS family protein [Halioglobus sp.]|nr:MoaD/ThiS family protein [Halioglobus sp.]